MEQKHGEIAIKLRSEPMNEMLSEPPKWIVRSGSILFFFVLLLLLGLAWFIHYPDEVKGDFLLRGSEAPVELVNQSDAQLDVLYVGENQEIEKGDVIARFDPAAGDQEIKEKIDLWIAPCSGKIMFNKILQVNRFYKAKEASVVIVPKSNGHFALATIAASGAGKVRIGQKTLIELTDFPKAEFGMLEGKVAGITQMEKDGKYEVNISLPEQLKTSYNKQIPFKVQLKGTVKIITKDKRLLERFFEQLTDLME